MITFEQVLAKNTEVLKLRGLVDSYTPEQTEKILNSIDNAYYQSAGGEAVIDLTEATHLSDFILQQMISKALEYRMKSRGGNTCFKVAKGSKFIEELAKRGVNEMTGLYVSVVSPKET